MKLTKKLLPLAFVATTAAAIVPMTVSCSCSKNKGEIKVNDLQDFFEKGTYTRETEALAKKEVKVDPETRKSTEATNAYFEALQDNPKYLADDIWAFLASIGGEDSAEPEFKLPFTIKGSLGIATTYSKDNKTVDVKLNCDVTISDIKIEDDDDNGQYDFLKEAVIKAKGSIWLNGFKTGVAYIPNQNEDTGSWRLYIDYTNDGKALSDFWTNNLWEVGADLSINVGGYDDAGASGSFNISLNKDSDLVKFVTSDEEKHIALSIQRLFQMPILKLGTLENFVPKA